MHQGRLNTFVTRTPRMTGKRKTAIDHTLSRWLAVASKAPYLTHHELFQQFCTQLDKSYVPLTNYSDIYKYMDQDKDGIIVAIKAALEEAAEFHLYRFISLYLDGWTDDQKNHYLALVVFFVSKDFKFMKAVLAVRHVPMPSYTTQFLLPWFLEILGLYNIDVEKHIHLLGCDNAEKHFAVALVGVERVVICKGHDANLCNSHASGKKNYKNARKAVLRNNVEGKALLDRCRKHVSVFKYSAQSKKVSELIQRESFYIEKKYPFDQHKCFKYMPYMTDNETRFAGTKQMTVRLHALEEPSYRCYKALDNADIIKDDPTCE